MSVFCEKDWPTPCFKCDMRLRNISNIGNFPSLYNTVSVSSFKLVFTTSLVVFCVSSVPRWDSVQNRMLNIMYLNGSQSCDHLSLFVPIKPSHTVDEYTKAL